MRKARSASRRAAWARFPAMVIRLREGRKWTPDAMGETGVSTPKGGRIPASPQAKKIDKGRTGRQKHTVDIKGAGMLRAWLRSVPKEESKPGDLQ